MNMERHALLFRVKPGTEDAVAEILAAYQRPPTDIDAETRLLGTTVLMHGNVVVRTMQIEGSLPRVAAHLARQPEIQAAERGLNPYLLVPRDMSGPEGARAFFQRSAMTLLTHRGAPVLPPGVTRHAVLYPLRPGTGAAADAVFTGGGDPPPQAGSDPPARHHRLPARGHRRAPVRDPRRPRRGDRAPRPRVRAAAGRRATCPAPRRRRRHLRRGRAAAVLPRAS